LRFLARSARLKEAVMIGDRLENDIRPARLQGWKTIRITGKV
jgi:FMN phosphatase YigB (HAD superfamily)